MPEAHTLHRLALDIGKTLEGPIQAESPQGRFSQGAKLIDGNKLKAASAYGKLLFLDFDIGPLLMVHLGLIGKFTLREPSDTYTPNVRLSLTSTSQHRWDLAGPNECSLITRDEAYERTETLGPDPLGFTRTAFDRQVPLTRRQAEHTFTCKLLSKRTSIGAALLDQRVVAGIGNVFRSELCFLTGVHPLRTCDQLTSVLAGELWRLATRLLRDGVKYNMIVTRSSTEVRGNARLTDSERLYVYKRAGLPCHRCGQPIQQLTVANRKMWFCPYHQPE